jgi:glycerol-3-phosphate acyltransferase PlsY
MWWIVLLSALIGYLIGSLPTGYVVIKLVKGEDIRQHGSGRTGGTNALRAGGGGAAFLTTVGDIFKGYAAVALTRLLVGQDLMATSLGTLTSAVAGLAAVLGHNWSVYMGFKGGAGTAPNVGASIAFWPLAGMYLVPMIPILGLLIIGYASVTSMVIAGVILVTFVVRAVLEADPNWWYVAYAAAAAAAVVWALRPNIKRLREGTERMVGLRARIARRQGKSGELKRN